MTPARGARRAIMGAALLFALALATGCSERAVLDVTLHLPAAAGTFRFAHVQVRSGPQFGFDDSWTGPQDPPGTALSTAGGTDKTLSVIADSDQEQQVLRIKVRFCTTSLCADELEGGPAVGIELPRAFYLGESTAIDVAIETIPEAPALRPPPIVIDPCNVRGCTEGTPLVDGGYCDPSTGEHFCEQS